MASMSKPPVKVLRTRSNSKMHTDLAVAIGASSNGIPMSQNMREVEGVGVPKDRIAAIVANRIISLREHGIDEVWVSLNSKYDSECWIGSVIGYEKDLMNDMLRTMGVLGCEDRVCTTAWERALKPLGILVENNKVNTNPNPNHRPTHRTPLN